MKITITLRKGVDPSGLQFPGNPIIDGQTITYPNAASAHRDEADGFYYVDGEPVAPLALIEGRANLVYTRD